MKAKDYIPLVGLKSTSPELVAFFEKNELGKPPKTVNANQGSKGAADKAQGISYYFTFNIKNDLFYPPVCAKNDNYTFYAYLRNIGLFSIGNKKAKVDEDFWEDFFHPKSNYEDFKKYFSEDEVSHDARYGQSVAKKKLNDFCILQVFFDVNKNEVKEISIAIEEHWELLSQYDFLPDNEHNTLKHADALIVKWLFDQRYLILPEDVYAKGLGFGLEEIREFVQQHLKNHVWDSQLNQVHNLPLFLSNLKRNTSYETRDGERVELFFNHQYFKASGQWEKHQELKKNDIKASDELETTLLLTNAQSQVLLDNVTTQYDYFLNNKKGLKK